MKRFNFARRFPPLRLLSFRIILRGVYIMERLGKIDLPKTKRKSRIDGENGKETVWSRPMMLEMFLLFERLVMANKTVSIYEVKSA